jgi:hypothetical protein
MKEKLRFLGLDVHAETIAAAIAEPGGEVRSLGTIPNRAESIRKMIKKLGPAEKLRACYEAGPTGYVVYWQLAELGHRTSRCRNFGSRRSSRPIKTLNVAGSRISRSVQHRRDSGDLPNLRQRSSYQCEIAKLLIAGPANCLTTLLRLAVQSPPTNQWTTT